MDKGADNYLRFLNGDKDGFTRLVEEYTNGLILFINCIVGDIHIAEEAADETFLKLYLKKPRYKSEYSFKTWLYTIGKNTALNHVKKYKKSAWSPIEDYYYISDDTDIEAEYIKSEENKQLHQAISKLKKEYAQVLYLIYFEGLNNTETANVMGRSKEQISVLIHRAKNALKAKLKQGEQHE